MIQRSFYFLIIMIFVFSCNQTSKYPGYSKTKSGIHYKLHSFSESEKKVAPGDYITTDISYATMNDSTFFEGRRKFQVTEPEFEGSVDECFLMMNKGEKATFILPAEQFFRTTLEADLPDFLKNDDSLKISVNMIEVQREDEFLKEKEAFLSWINDFGEYEKVQLQHFLEEQKLDATPTESGIYHIVLEEGDGPDVDEGDTVLVHYEGKFLNGKFFDSSKQRKQPLEFVYGQEWQVIEGMEEVINLMHEGETALAIFPSEHAFGKSGSSTGIVPPYTSVIYQVTLLEVRKNKS